MCCVGGFFMGSSTFRHQEMSRRTHLADRLGSAMKVIPHTIRKLLPSALGLALAGTGFSASIIDSAAFFDPDFRARRPGATSGLLSLAVNNTPYSVTNPPPGDTIWNHTASGLIQSRTNVLGLIGLDVQVAGYTETTGNSLVFGREITAEASAVGAEANLSALVNSVAGATGVQYNWESTVTATLPIDAGQRYQVSFEVTTGDGLTLGLLDSASFGISTPGITGTSAQGNAQLLNLLDILVLGGDRTGEFTFDFTSAQELDSLEFFFKATDLAGVRLLGGTEGNENVLTFSNFEINAIPEPSSLVISALGVGLLLFRRRRVA